MTQLERSTHQRLRAALRSFLAQEAAGGIVLMVVAALALIVANSALAPLYFRALAAYIGPLNLLHWINDGLMAVFFLLVGLEIKRELVVGQLSTWRRRALPGIAAFGGMVVPALIYVAINGGSPATLRGWAIPAATDIAFALGVLSLLGPRVPNSLRIFLAALAILDDLGAVAIIAIFYTADLWFPAQGASLFLLFVLGAMNHYGVTRLAPYLLVGALLWVVVLLSGVHATLAGVALAFFIPLRTVSAEQEGHSPLERLEHTLHPWVAFLIVPVFGFANAGVPLAGASLATLLAPVPFGIAAGLFVGKQVGVFAFSLLAIRLRLAAMPDHATLLQLYGVAVLCGIGFTMSLFIGLLAFSSPALQDQVKIGVLAGSLASTVLGALVLLLAGRRR